jgi:hypothetical protein
VMETVVRAVAVPARVWVTVPGTQLQVKHGAGRTGWCRVHEDGSLTFGDSGMAWVIRPARW